MKSPGVIYLAWANGSNVVGGAALMWKGIERLRPAAVFVAWEISENFEFQRFKINF